MKGTVYKRKLPSGRISWAVSVDAGRDESGKRKRVFKSGFDRKLDADIELAKILNDKNEGSLVRPDPRTFAEFVESWLSEYAETSCSPKTAERYGEMLGQVSRLIGQQPLSKITTLQLQRVYNQLLKCGKKDGTPLSIKTVRNIHGAVHVAFETAIDWCLLRANPASRCKLPPAPKKEAMAFDFSDSRKLLESSSDHWLSNLLIVDTASGGRRGEMLALTWPNVNFDDNFVVIRRSLEETKKLGLRVKETKGRNIRRLELPSDAMDALKRVRASQLEHRKFFGPDYRSDLDLVFCHPDGSYIRPGTVTKAVRRLVKKAGFSGASLHTLRHSNGSQMLSAGVPLAVVSKRLGHGDIYTTARIYAHALASDESAAAAKWDAAMKRVDKANVVTIPLKKQA